ncbi:MAG: SGNH/GDSL hydrolase family protein [Planctomycetota bacterium]
MRRTRRLAVLLFSSAMSLALAELAVRWWLPGGYRLVALTTEDGREAPLAEAWHYLYHYTEREREPSDGPRGRLPSSIRQWIRYDRPQWDYFDDQGRVLTTTNSLGFRDLDFARAKPAGEYRVLALGDSFTYGLGVPLERTWPQLLEQHLRETGPAEVINAGWPNTSPADTLGWFAADGIAFEPDLVLVAICLNDLGAVSMLGYPQAKPEPWLGGASVLLNHLQREWEQRSLMREPPDQAANVEKDPRAFLATKAALRAIRDLCKERKVRMLMAVLPMMTVLDDRYPYRRLHQWLAEFAEVEGIESVDLLADFLGTPERELWVHPTDQHPNHVGHQRIADALGRAIAAKGLGR